MTTICEAQRGVEMFHLKHGFKTGLLQSLVKGPLEGQAAWLQDWLTTGIQRSHMIVQEASELMEAWHDQDVVEIADAIGDLLYVVLGSAAAAGIDVEPIFNEIQCSNMTKSRNEGRSPLHPKGENYQPPDLKSILLRQFTREASNHGAEALIRARQLFEEKP